MERLQAFGEGLELTQETELLQFDIAQPIIRLGELQDIQEEGAVDGNLIGRSQCLLALSVKTSL